MLININSVKGEEPVVGKSGSTTYMVQLHSGLPFGKSGSTTYGAAALRSA